MFVGFFLSAGKLRSHRTWYACVFCLPMLGRDGQADFCLAESGILTI